MLDKVKVKVISRKNKAGDEEAVVDDAVEGDLGGRDEGSRGVEDGCGKGDRGVQSGSRVGNVDRGEGAVDPDKYLRRLERREGKGRKGGGGEGGGGEGGGKEGRDLVGEEDAARAEAYGGGFGIVGRGCGGGETRHFLAAMEMTLMHVSDTSV